MKHDWKHIDEPDGDHGKRRTKVINAAHDNFEIWVYICPKNPLHYYAAPDWTPRNDELLETQTRRAQDGGKTIESEARINCPYCHVPRVPHLVKEMIPFRDMATKQVAATVAL